MIGSDGNPIVVLTSDNRCDMAKETSGTHDMTSEPNREMILSSTVEDEAGRTPEAEVVFAATEADFLLLFGLLRGDDEAKGIPCISTSIPFFQYLTVFVTVDFDPKVGKIGRTIETLPPSEVSECSTSFFVSKQLLAPLLISFRRNPPCG
jgi:hypothetical protein